MVHLVASGCGAVHHWPCTLSMWAALEVGLLLASVHCHLVAELLLRNFMTTEPGTCTSHPSQCPSMHRTRSQLPRIHHQVQVSVYSIQQVHKYSHVVTHELPTPASQQGSCLQTHAGHKDYVHAGVTDNPASYAHLCQCCWAYPTTKSNQQHTKKSYISSRAAPAAGLYPCRLDEQRKQVHPAAATPPAAAPARLQDTGGGVVQGYSSSSSPSLSSCSSPSSPAARFRFWPWGWSCGSSSSGRHMQHSIVGQDGWTAWSIMCRLQPSAGSSTSTTPEQLTQRRSLAATTRLLHTRASGTAGARQGRCASR